MTRVYVAASSREVERVRRCQALAAEWGWELTLDWLTPMLANIDRGVRDTDLPADEQHRHAEEDRMAIYAANLVWFLAPNAPTKGAWYELGWAHGIGKPVVVSGCAADPAPMLFLAHEDIVERDEDVGAWWRAQR